MIEYLLIMLVVIFIMLAVFSSAYTIILIRRKAYDNFIKRNSNTAKKLHLPR